MEWPIRIHVFGASGAGTTTLGAALAARLGIAHLDVDDFYWQLTDPPYRVKNEPAQRVVAIKAALAGANSWVLSGSLVSWGEPLVRDCTHAVFLTLDPAVRMARLLEREKARHGKRIEPGGAMHNDHVAFMAWARAYDTASGGQRCLRVHQDWLRKLPCAVLTLDSSSPTENLVSATATAIGGGPDCG